MKASKPESNYEAPPKGNHVARLYQIIYLGTTSYDYMGESKRSTKVRMTFELCDERKEFKPGEGEKPFSISREFGFYMGKQSKLRPFVEGYVGTSLSDDEAYEFDIDDMLGKACLLNVVHGEKDGKVYGNIASASPLPKGMVAPEIFNETSIVNVNSSDPAEIDALPKFIKEKMYASEEWKSREKHLSNMAEYNVAKAHRPDVVKDRMVIEDSFENDVPFP